MPGRDFGLVNKKGLLRLSLWGVLAKALQSAPQSFALMFLNLQAHSFKQV